MFAPLVRAAGKRAGAHQGAYGRLATPAYLPFRQIRGAEILPIVRSLDPECSAEIEAIASSRRQRDRRSLQRHRCRLGSGSRMAS